MEPTREQSYRRRIAELEAQLGELVRQNHILIQQNAKLTEQNTRLTEANATLTQQVAKLDSLVETPFSAKSPPLAIAPGPLFLAVWGSYERIKLEEQVARLSKNSSNSSKPPSSDIVKPPKEAKSKGRRQGGQPGHRGVNRQPFATEQIDQTVEVPAGRCCCGHKGRGQPMDEPRIQQVAELPEKPIMVTEYRLHGYVCSKCGREAWPRNRLSVSRS